MDSTVAIFFFVKVHYCTEDPYFIMYPCFSKNHIFLYIKQKSGTEKLCLDLHVFLSVKLNL